MEEENRYSLISCLIRIFCYSVYVPDKSLKYVKDINKILRTYKLLQLNYIFKNVILS